MIPDQIGEVLSEPPSRNWAKLIDVETSLPTNIQEPLEQRATREGAD